tara:strand:+ start:282 stop:653 length:372 start_codon:yes stop_codon:yes gene_type:complete
MKKLNTKLESTKKNIIKNFVIESNQTIFLAIEKIAQNSHRTIIVTKKNKVIGVVSEGDIIKAALRRVNFNSNLANITNKSFKFLLEDDKIQAKKIFKKDLVGILPILDKNMKIKKIYTLKDFI